MQTRMTLAAGIAIGAVLSFAVTRAQDLAADRDTRQAVTALKQAIVRGHMEKDAAALADLYADDYTATTSAGVVRTKADLLAALPTDARLVEGRYELVAVRRWGNVAVASGRGHLVSIRDDGTRRTSDYYSFNVFEQRDGRWWYVAAFLP